MLFAALIAMGMSAIYGIRSSTWWKLACSSGCLRFDLLPRLRPQIKLIDVRWKKIWFRMSLYVFAHDDFLPKIWWVSGHCISYKTHSSDKPCAGVWEHLHLTHETKKVLSRVFCIINTVYEPTANTIIFACRLFSWLFTSSSLEVWAALCNLVMKSMAVFGHSDVQQGDTVFSSHSLSLKSKV